jgi:lipid-binding SYLF domain-containing protein
MHILQIHMDVGSSVDSNWSRKELWHEARRHSKGGLKVDKQRSKGSVYMIHMIAVSAVGLAVIVGACAGGLTGSKEEKHAYFDHLEQDTLARLIKERPAVEKELADSVGYLVADQKVVKGPLIGAGGGAGVVVEKASGKRSYLRIPELQFGAGWGARAEKTVLVFQDLDKLRDLADGKWHAGVEAEAAAKAGDVGAAGSGSTTDLTKKGFSTYVLTDAGVSATATVAVIRVQPYSIE